MTKAWMLRQDGESYPLKIHIYGMEDKDLSSEAEVASFLIYTDSKDMELSKYILDAWMMYLIEEDVYPTVDSEGINELIESKLNSLPYKFPYPLSSNQYLKIHDELNNYYDIDSYYEFYDTVQSRLSELQKNISLSLNQQFCRVRYGGEYNDEGVNTIWFRISSTGFNWSNTIYEFVADNYKSLKIEAITICRDYESDNGSMNDDNSSEYFYKAKDGVVYYNMPIVDYFEESHESNPIFSNTIVSSRDYFISNKLSSGGTWYEIRCYCKSKRLAIDISSCRWKQLKDEWDSCILASEFMENAPTRTRAKLGKVITRILNDFPEIEDIDLDATVRENSKGNPVGTNYIFKLESKNKRLDGLEVKLGYTKPSTPIDVIYRDFRRDYTDYKDAMKI